MLAQKILTHLLLDSNIAPYQFKELCYGTRKSKICGREYKRSL